MSPRDGGSTESLAGASNSLGETIDWSWIDNLNPEGESSIAEEDLNRLVQVFNDGRYTPVLPGSDSENENVPNMEEFEKLHKMFKLATLALKSRDSELTEAIEEMAANPPSSEMQEIVKELEDEKEKLKKENKDLKNQIKKFKRAKTGQGAIEDLLAVEQDLEQARKENADLERDLERERRSKEQIESKLEIAEKERTNLRREVDSLRDEVSDLRLRISEGDDTVEDEDGTGGEATSSASSPGGRGRMETEDKRRIRDMEETIRMKNKQIHQLLEDVEEVERDGNVCREKVVELRDRLSEATQQINAMAGEYAAVKDSAQRQSEHAQNLTEENARLQTTIEEQMKDRMKRESQLEKIELEVEKRVTKMRSLLDLKDATIEELRSRLKNIGTSGGDSSAKASKPQGSVVGENYRENMALMTKALRDREDQIEELQEKVAQATRDLESSAKIVEELKANRVQGTKQKGIDPLEKSLIEVRAQLHQAENRITLLEEEKTEAEDVARDKTEELSETIARLRAYEKGEYGLEAAVDEVKTIKRTLKFRENRIEELTQTCNNLQFQTGELLEDNTSMREKLGISPRQRDASAGKPPPLTKQQVAEKKQQETRALMQVMQREIERLEEERIQLKTENRKLARQIGGKAANLGLDADDLRAMQEYRDALRERRRNLTNKDSDVSELDAVISHHETVRRMQLDLENKNVEIENLRKAVVDAETGLEEMTEENKQLTIGLEETLDIIKNADANSNCAIFAPTLEKLLTILDARHLWGNYHPAMGLKAKIEKLDGANEELREQLRKAKLEEERSLSAIQRAQNKIANLQSELATFKEEGAAQDTGPGVIMQNAPSIHPPSHTMSSLSPIPPHSGSIITASNGEHLSKVNTQLIQVLDHLHEKENECKDIKSDLENEQRQFAVLRHQMGLMYEDFTKERLRWKDLEKDLKTALASSNENLDGARAKITEYEANLDVISKHESGELTEKDLKQCLADTTRKIAALRSNEALMVRRYKAIEDSEMNSRKECIKLREEVVNIENAVTEKIGELQRYKDMAAYKIDSLQKNLAASVPQSTLDEANREYAEITMKYRDVLENENTKNAQERRQEEYDLIMEKLRQEKKTISDELLASKEKLISLEGLNEKLLAQQRLGSTESHSHSSDILSSIKDNQVDSLSKQIATLEIKLMNEKERADHADSRYKLLQSQNSQIEKRNEELELKFADITKVNLDLQKTERELRDQIVTSIPKEHVDELEKRVKELEKIENELRIESDKLKEVADVARNQVEMFESKAEIENIEMEAFRHQVIDLQTQTDEKALIGRLHRQIVGLQTKESQCVGKIHTMSGKIGRLEAQLFRMSRKVDEKEDLVIQARSQAYIKCRSLHKIIQDLRRQYSGCIPISRQENISKLLREMNEDKRKLTQELKGAEEKREEAETQASELLIKKHSLDELLVEIGSKGPRSAAKTREQVIEWQKKLEDIRLRELRSRRNADRWAKEVEHLRELCSTQSRKLDQLEEENVRLENQLEQKQLDWETRDVELEELQDELEEGKEQQRRSKQMRNQKDGGIKKEGIDQIGGMPNPELPLSQQLGQSFDKIKSQSQSIKELKGKLADVKRLADDLQKKLRESESMMLAKDRIINDLRMQVPTSVDRALAMASVTGGPGLPVALTEDYESKQALSIAQSTVTSLRDRLAQKEETLEKYEKLLKQGRVENENEIRKKQEEIVTLKTTIKNQGQALAELKASTSEVASDIANVGAQSTGGIIADKVNRIQELEDEVQELGLSFGELSHQLAVARNESNSHLHSLNAKIKELEDVKDNAQVESQMATHKHKQEIDQLNNDLKVLRHENSLLQNDLREAKEAQERAPSAVMSTLVEKLRTELAEKEKKQRAMGRALADLKKELVQQAEDGLTSNNKETHSEFCKLQKLNESMTKDLTISQNKIEELNGKIDRLQQQVRMAKDKESISAAEVKHLKADISRKSTAILRLKEDKVTKDQSKPASPGRPSSRTGLSMVAADNKEKEELKAIIRNLEEKLKVANKAERPFEDTTTKFNEREELQQIDRPSKEEKNAEEIARWDESKKWQKKLEVLKGKLAESDVEVSKLSKENKGLRDLITRLEREKTILDGKVKSASRELNIKTNVLTVRFEEATAEAKKLREEMDATRHGQLMKEPQGVETLKMRNKFLQERIEAQERKISNLELSRTLASSGSSGKKTEAEAIIKKLTDAEEKEKECQKEKHRIEEENMKLKLKLERAVEHRPILLQTATSLNNIIITMKSDGDRRNTGIELELQNVFDTMKSALGESELDSIMQNISSKDQHGYAKLGSKTPSIKKKPGGDVLGTPSNVKSISNTSKEGKIMIEEMKKLKAMNEQLIDKLETKCQLVETLERDLLDARRKVNQRKSSLESGSRKMSLSKSEEESDTKFSQVKDAIMKEPDLEPKMSSEIGSKYTMAELRRLEADLKRKSDLLSEVKVLLAQAAERERSLISERDEAKSKIRILLEISPKDQPAERLAKELRQTRLTVDRLECEKKELENQIKELETNL